MPGLIVEDPLVRLVIFVQVSGFAADAVPAASGHRRDARDLFQPMEEVEKSPLPNRPVGNGQLGSSGGLRIDVVRQASFRPPTRGDIVFQPAAGEDGVILTNLLLKRLLQMPEVAGERPVDRSAFLGCQVSSDTELLPCPMDHHPTQAECAGLRKIEMAPHQSGDLTEARLRAEFDRECDSGIDVGMVKGSENAADLLFSVPGRPRSDLRSGELLPFAPHLLSPRAPDRYSPIDPLLNREPLIDLQQNHDAALRPRRTAFSGFDEALRQSNP